MGRNVALEADVRAMGPRLVDPEDPEGAALLSTAKRAAFADRDLAGGEGLVLLKGQWVEVDPQRLRQAIEHWKSLKNQVRGDGVFAAGCLFVAITVLQVAPAMGADFGGALVIVPTGVGMKLDALLTRMSSRPKRAITAAMSAGSAATSSRSQAKAAADPVRIALSSLIRLSASPPDVR